MPEPTVKVRMKESARAGPLRIGGVGAHVIALGDVSVTGKEIAVTHTRSAFADANCHAESVSRLPIGASPLIPVQQVDVSTRQAGLTCVITLEDGSPLG